MLFLTFFLFIIRGTKERGFIMASLNEILRFNKEFVEQKQYVPYITDKFPNKKL